MEELKKLYYITQKRRTFANLEKHEAQLQVSRAIRSGALVRQPCEVCSCAKVDAHHPDYSKALEVRWLCRTHHAAEHVKLGTYDH